LLELGPDAEELTEAITQTRIRLRRLGGALATLFDGDATGQAEPDEGVTADGLTSQLSAQVRARQELGAPVPPTLIAWLDGSE